MSFKKIHLYIHSVHRTRQPLFKLCTLYQNTRIEQQTVYNTTVRLHYEMIKNIRVFLATYAHLTSPSRVEETVTRQIPLTHESIVHERYLCYCLRDGDTWALLGWKIFPRQVATFVQQSCPDSSRNDAVTMLKIPWKKVALDPRLPDI